MLTAIDFTRLGALILSVPLGCKTLRIMFMVVCHPNLVSSVYFIQQLNSIPQILLRGGTVVGATRIGRAFQVVPSICPDPTEFVEVWIADNRRSLVSGKRNCLGRRSLGYRISTFEEKEKLDSWVLSVWPCSPGIV
jgi:hypothetical protein